MVLEFWVEPEFRHHGAAKALLDLAVNEYAAMGIGQLRIRTALADEPARKMLEQAGFRPATIVMLRELQPKATRPRQPSNH
jgi:ribosomal protein S18 acetylase RimI-like enzyme